MKQTGSSLFGEAPAAPERAEREVFTCTICGQGQDSFGWSEGAKIATMRRVKEYDARRPEAAAREVERFDHVHARYECITRWLASRW